MAAVSGQTEEREGIENMMQIDSFSLKDIIISDDFSSTTPAAIKLDKVRKYVASYGELPASIVINNDNVLIDGYCTYLVALEMGADKLPVKRGYVELIEANHHAGQQCFIWRVPERLFGQIKAGDKCIVRTARGARRVRVERVLQQQYPTQQPPLKNVLKLL